MKQTIRAKLVAIRNGQYTKYVFQNLDVPEWNKNRYETIIQCPNWHDVPKMELGDEGFLELEETSAGEEYLKISTGQVEKYKYDTKYFINFIKATENKQKEFNF